MTAEGIVLVTGGSRGIGAPTASLLAEQARRRVVITDTAPKAGGIQISQTLAAEWGRTGVRVNAVSPGFTRTAALEAGIASGALNKELLESPTAMNRLVEPSEVAQAIAWLLSPLSSGVTG